MAGGPQALAEPVKIGIDAFFLNHPFNGIGQVTTNLIEALVRNSASPSVAEGLDWSQCEFYLYMAEDCGRAFPSHFRQRTLPLKWNKGTLSKKWWEARQLPVAVQRDGCDLLISLYQSAAVMPENFPHIMLVHDIIYVLFKEHTDNWRKQLNVWSILLGIRRASHCIAVSNHTKSDMMKYLAMEDDKISVAHNAVDPQFAVPLTRSQVEKVLQKHRLSPGYLYHGGGMHGRKNARGVLEAYRILLRHARHADLSVSLPPLVISGALASGVSGVSPLEELARELGIADHVVLLGHVPQADLPALYKGASVFLYPSRYEGFGLPILEAMHQGVPVVAANTSSLPEVGGDAVLYCDPDRPSEIAAAVLQILTNTTLSETLARRGLERSGRFTWRTLLEKLAKVSAELLQQRG